MSDSDLTTLGDMIGEHRFQDHRFRVGDMCICGWTSQNEPWSYHVASVLSGVYAITPLSTVSLNGDNWKVGDAMLRRDASEDLIVWLEEQAASFLALARHARKVQA